MIWAWIILVLLSLLANLSKVVLVGLLENVSIQSAKRVIRQSAGKFDRKLWIWRLLTVLREFL